MTPSARGAHPAAIRLALLFLLSLLTLSVLAELLVGSQPIAASINGQLHILPDVIQVAPHNMTPSNDWVIWPLIHTGATSNSGSWGVLLHWWMYTTRYSLLVTAVVALLASAAGAAGGWLAAAGPGFFDFSLRKLVELSGALPGLILVAALRVSGRIPVGLDVVLVLFVLRTIEIAHLVRSLMLSLGDRDFLVAARSVGGSPFHVLRWHLLPHLLRPLGALVVTTLASVVSLEAALSLIGLGTPQLASWGVMLITRPGASLHAAPLFALLSVLATTLALSVLARQLQSDRWVQRHHV